MESAERSFERGEASNEEQYVANPDATHPEEEGKIGVLQFDSDKVVAEGGDSEIGDSEGDENAKDASLSCIEEENTC
jgi:hypothetical protein